MPAAAALLTIPEAAPRLGVTPAVVRTWIRDGLVPAVSLPGGELGIPAPALRVTRRRLGFPD
jgi:hypothetical protein